MHETEHIPSTRSVGFHINLVSRAIQAYMPHHPNRGRVRVSLSHAARLRKDSGACVCCAKTARAVGAATAELLFALFESHATPAIFTDAC